mmetsp:Transcript_1754/g.2268  ORF Transcript_1754/g.2268 Transcript_1754/m.2268 type:complete len:107 (-) Transcript_1754:357-677(-)|eukprot:CAMPEP_0170512456 /NCGR_PEP_ID=MMETSP0208-20121228/66862_1 /TAXON_ID=197538 /ORGANISM="Strombidium inclinatum, Strain S3" /LENGTH=106 /DNA_ID=CAMNT_0010796089 /DNA_START=419 /DNA_END=739 /DNA_ORIENTATION=-
MGPAPPSFSAEFGEEDKSLHSSEDSSLEEDGSRVEITRRRDQTKKLKSLGFFGDTIKQPQKERNRRSKKTKKASRSSRRLSRGREGREPNPSSSNGGLPFTNNERI